MKHLPRYISFILFIALCASATYWVLQALQPAARPVVAPPVAAPTAPPLSAAAALLGGSAGVATGGDYALSGIIMAAHPADRIAILAYQGLAPRPYRLHTQLTAGVTLAEVHADHVVIDYRGTMKRIDLPVKPGLRVDTAPPVKRAAATTTESAARMPAH